MRIFGLNSLKKLAFTLAEVLITLGIIGVVAALTMPSLINSKRNKELQTAFKKAYSEINQASLKFYADEGISVSEYASTYNMLYVDKYMEYFKGAIKVNDWTWNSVGSDGQRTPVPYDLYPIKGSTKLASRCDNSGYIMDISGRIFSFNDPPANNENGPIVCIDVNGYKKPNRFGMDYFMFIFTVDGTVIPMGMQHKNNTTYLPSDGGGNFYIEGDQYCKSDSGHTDQYSCAMYALSDTNPQDETKSYWKDFIRGE